MLFIFGVRTFPALFLLMEKNVCENFTWLDSETLLVLLSYYAQLSAMINSRFLLIHLKKLCG